MSFLPFNSYSHPYAEEDINLIRPLRSYSQQIGILVSMLNWMRASVIRAVKDLTPADLDFLPDPEANTIGALLLHLAPQMLFQDLPFYNLKGFSENNKKKWGVAMGLGKEGRKQIKGNNLDYYLSALQQVREKTLIEFKKRDDKWFGRL